MGAKWLSIYGKVLKYVINHKEDALPENNPLRSSETRDTPTFYDSNVILQSKQEK